MKEAIEIALVIIAAISSPIAIIIFILLLFPDQIEKWSSIFWRLTSRVLRFAHKKYVKHDLQSRVNGFVKKMKKEVPDIGNERLKIEWIDAETDRESFINQGKVILRLRRDDPEDQNFVHGAYYYVSCTLLNRAKLYLSKAQKAALDLFVCSKLVKAEKPASVQFFVSEYLHKSTEKSDKIKGLVDDFAIIDEGKLFFPVLVQELHFIGEKIFGRLKDNQIINEVGSLVDFLKPIVGRKIGEHSQLDYHGPYCKFAIVIVGKASKLAISIDPYVKFIENRLLPGQVETIYLICRRENRDKVKEIAAYFDATHYVKQEVVSAKSLRYEDGSSAKVKEFLLVMRKRDVDLVQPSTAA